MRLNFWSKLGAGSEERGETGGGIRQAHAHPTIQLPCRRHCPSHAGVKIRLPSCTGFRTKDADELQENAGGFCEVVAGRGRRHADEMEFSALVIRFQITFQHHCARPADRTFEAERDDESAFKLTVAEIPIGRRQYTKG